jgi:4-diphosphocytidyl-2-C-methyl-D-erythritol kinase
MPTVIAERARAKINLTLAVHGRRGDGYHELESLVAFADVGDRITLDPARPPGVSVTGPFAGALGRETLVSRTLETFAAAAPGAHLGHVEIEKSLPIAAGLGGGSADAAATLRALRAINPGVPTSVFETLARSLGADVPVCLGARSAIMRGTGELITPITLATLHVVIINTCAPVAATKTAGVFRQLAAPSIDGPPPRHLVDLPRSGAAADWIDVLARHTNDLEIPAQILMPEIARAKAALAGLPGARIIRLSGAGPTSFAIYDTRDATERAARALTSQHPDWWIIATTVGKD